jgi:hypothetical protein
MISFVDHYHFKGNECKGVLVYEIAFDHWKTQIEIMAQGFESSDHAKKAVIEAIDAFDMKLLQIKAAYQESKNTGSKPE